MIKNTIEHTKSAVFSILLPDKHNKRNGFDIPTGTGFFISSDGYFITAAHVIEEDDENRNPIIIDGKKKYFSEEEIILKKPMKDNIQNIKIIKIWDEFDIALLKADFEKNKNDDLLKTKENFDFLEIDFNIIEEGSSVYSFGYPMPDLKFSQNPTVTIGSYIFCPRITSAIISSHDEMIGPVRKKGKYPNIYVIDKALNYGNSGGPIILTENGKTISVVSRFQPVTIPQKETKIMIPSLYGITYSFKNIEKELLEIINHQVK